MGGLRSFARLGALPMARRLKQLGALAAIGVGAAGFYWLHLGSSVEWTQEAFQSYVSDLGPLGPAILVGTMAMRPFLGLPSGLILLTAGLLFGTLAGTFYGALGGTLGAVIALGVARALGRDAVQRRIGGSLAAFDDYLTRRGPPWLAAYTAIPVSVLSPVYFTAGVTRMRATPFTLAIAIGFLPTGGPLHVSGEYVPRAEQLEPRDRVGPDGPRARRHPAGAPLPVPARSSRSVPALTSGGAPRAW